MKQLYTVPPQYNGCKLHSFLRGGCGMSASAIRSVKFLPDGITRAGEKINTNTILAAGDEIAVCFPPDEPTVTPQPELAFSVLFETPQIVVADKPAGMAVHPTLNYPCGTLANAFTAWADGKNEPMLFRPVYRLDKDTSGCLLVAKNRLEAAALSHGCTKKYCAIVMGSVEGEDGCVELPIDFAPGSIIKRAALAQGKPSCTLYRVIGRSPRCTLLELMLVTGRTHQIRVHMSAVGHPLLGDTLYGEPSELIGRQALHCAQITFVDEQGTQQCVASPFPPDFVKAAAAAGLNLPRY